MRHRTYLNVILTANAVLLAGLLWTQVATTPLLSTEAAAQKRTRFFDIPTIPNAAKQRNELINGLRAVQQSIDGTRQLLESGRVKVEVTNLDEIPVGGP